MVPAEVRMLYQEVFLAVIRARELGYIITVEDHAPATFNNGKLWTGGPMIGLKEDGRQVMPRNLTTVK